MTLSDRLTGLMGKVLWTTVTPKNGCNDKDFRMEVTHLNRVYQKVLRDYIENGKEADGLGEWFFNELSSVMTNSVKKKEEQYGTLLKWDSVVADFSVELWSFTKGKEVGQGVFAGWVRTKDSFISLESFLSGEIKGFGD